MDESQKQKLRQAGFSDDDIAEYESQNASTSAPSSSGPSAADETIPNYMGNAPQPTPSGQILSNGAQLWNGVNDFVSSPVGHLVEGGGAMMGAKNLLKQYMGAKTATEAPPAAGSTPGPTPEAPAATSGDAWSNKVVGGMGPGGNSVTEAARNYQIQKGLTPTEANQFAVNRSGVIVPNAPAAPATPTMPTPPNPNAVGNAGNFLSRMSNLYERYGSSAVGQTMSKAGSMLGKAAPYLEGAGKLVAPAMIAKELFYTSPEERAILQKAEAEKRAQGWKPINER